MSTVALPDNPRVLVVALRRLGDVLLTTPLIRSVKRAFPAAAIEALVYAGTEGILAGNPDLAGVITLPQHPRWTESLAIIRQVRRRYDLALSAVTGDRPTTLAWFAGRESAGLIEAKGVAAAVKRLALGRASRTQRGRHRILDVLGIAEVLGIAALPEVVVPAGDVRPDLVPAQPYAVIHAAATADDARWRIDGWRMLTAALRARGLAIVVSGGSADRAYLDGLWGGREVTRLDGQIEWPELAAVIRGARVYVGLDTAVTHLAAATGAPTVALYGSSEPQAWGPWPSGGLDRPWESAVATQNCGNVWLVQDQSSGRGLKALAVAQVLAAIDRVLAAPQAA